VHHHHGLLFPLEQGWTNTEHQSAEATIFCRVATEELWLLSTELVLYHTSRAQNFQVTPDCWKMCAPLLQDYIIDASLFLVVRYMLSSSCCCMMPMSSIISILVS
jgi:hypothetical protein